MFHPSLKWIAASATLLLAVSSAQAAHVFAGLLDTNSSSTFNAGDALSFVNSTSGAAVTGPSLGLQSMSQVTVGDQAGLYMTNGITFTALQRSGNVWNGTAYIAAKAFGASPGAYLELRIDSVTGPAGAHFSFWDDGATTPTFTIATGLTGGTNAFLLTNDGITYGDQPQYVGDGVTPSPTTPNGIPPTDPYGHIHGRSVTTDQEGTYTVSYVIHDRRGIQADSAPFVVTYGAVPEPTTAALLGGAGMCFALLRRR
ncbi:MAG: PEP-CTERM sorting domain-containing protein, partial [Chthoniobacteraceae bacterium]